MPKKNQKAGLFEVIPVKKPKLTKIQVSHANWVAFCDVWELANEIISENKAAKFRERMNIHVNSADIEVAHDLIGELRQFVELV